MKECFENIWKNNKKLNPEKCTFSIKDEKFLGFMISQRGIKANPEKIKAIMERQYLRIQKV